MSARTLRPASCRIPAQRFRSIFSVRFAPDCWIRSLPQRKTVFRFRSEARRFFPCSPILFQPRLGCAPPHAVPQPIPSFDFPAKRTFAEAKTLPKHPSGCFSFLRQNMNEHPSISLQINCGKLIRIPGAVLLNFKKGNNHAEQRKTFQCFISYTS